MASAELDHASGVPLYRQIKDILRREITEGVADPSTPMTEELLLGRFDVSRAPVRQALRELADEGFVYRKQGKGTFPVAGARVSRPADVRPGALYEYLERSGQSPHSVVTGLERTLPPTSVRDRLRLDEGETLVHFTRLISVGGTPLVEAEVWVRAPLDFNPRPADLTGKDSAFELLKKGYGITLDRAEHEAWATSASERMAKVMEVEPGAPLLVIDTTFFTLGGVPAGYRSAIHRADEFKYRFVTLG